MLSLAATAALGLVATSCDGDDAFIGSWTASVPLNISADIPAASTATSLMSIDFMKGQGSSHEGTFYMSSLVNATQPVTFDSVPGTAAPYEVSVSATTGVEGTWRRADDDELMIQFDMQSLKVTVDPQNVMFSQNMLNGAQQPAVDSLTQHTAAIWQRQIQTAVTATLHRYAILHDVEVEDNKTTLKFEVKDAANRDLDIVMHRVINGD